MNTNRLNFFRFAVLLFCVLIGFTIAAQKQNANPKANELREKKKKLNKDIENLNSILDETTTGKKLTMFQVQAINMKISARQELINTINAEIKLMNGQISKKQKEIERKNAELDTLKNRYKKMVYYAYRNKQAYNKIMFVFASNDFNQAYARVKYMQEINIKRHSHADSIVKKQTQLGQEQVDLQGKITEKKSLLGSEETEKVSLAKEKSEQEEMLGKLSSKEKQIKDELDQKKKDAQALDRKIKEMIEEEIRIAKAKAEADRIAREKAEADRIAKANKNNPKNPKIKNENPLPENPKPRADVDQELSADFASNKGKLPFPVAKGGVITEGFGPHADKNIKNFETFNNGVDITTPKGGIARAIFDGEVTGVAAMPDGNGKLVMVRHGSFISVYTNLSAVYVKQGDKIKVKQNIGEIDFNEEKGGTTMNLQIWKGLSKLNPEDWLFKGG